MGFETWTVKWGVLWVAIGLLGVGIDASSGIGEWSIVTNVCVQGSYVKEIEIIFGYYKNQFWLGSLVVRTF